MKLLFVISLVSYIVLIYCHSTVFTCTESCFTPPNSLCTNMLSLSSFNIHCPWWHGLDALARAGNLSDLVWFLLLAV